MSRLPLPYLAVFRVAARSQNLRAAAEVLHLTHSAVSQQVRALEGQLGYPLFERQGRRLVLKPAGKALAASVELAWVELERGLQAAAAANGSLARTLRVSTLPSLAQRWLMPRLARWQALQPGIALDLHTSQALIDLEHEGFHLAIRQGRGAWPGLKTEPLFESWMAPMAAPALAQRLIGQPLAALANETLLGEATQWTDWFRAQGHAHSVVPMASFNDAGLMLQAAEQGMGVALTRELLAADALLEGRLVRVAARHALDSEQHRYHLVYPPALENEPALRTFRAWLHAEVAQSAAALTGQITGSETRPANR